MKVQAVPLSLCYEDECYLRWLAQDNPDEEVCGLIRLGNRIERLENIAHDKTHSFVMDFWPNDNILAVWHTHNNGLARPSQDDVPVMNMMYNCGYKYNWIIVTSFGAFEYRLTDIG